MKLGLTILILVIALLGIIFYINNFNVSNTGNVVLEPINLQGTTIPIDTEKSKIRIEGSGDDGEHIGTFEEWSGIFYLENNNIIGVRGTINPKSVKTNNLLLDKGLQGKDYFNSDIYPNIMFIGFLENTNNLEEPFIEGELTLRGITFPQDFELEIDENSMIGGFRINSKDYDFGKDDVIGQIEIDFEFYK